MYQLLSQFELSERAVIFLLNNFGNLKGSTNGIEELKEQAKLLGLFQTDPNVSYDSGLTWSEEVLITDTDYLNAYHDLEVHSDGSLHFVYYNYGASNNLENVKYRYSESDISEMSPSIPLGIVTTEMMPCHCCQPDLEIDQNGDIYVIYRNNIQNIRDTYLAVKRYSDNTFSEYYQVSDTQDYIGFCPSSGPSLDINNEEIAISYTSYNDENAYISLSTLNDLDFTGNIISTSNNDNIILFPNNTGIVEFTSPLKIQGGNPGASKVLTSDATGLATWETPSAGGNVIETKLTSIDDNKSQ